MYHDTGSWWLIKKKKINRQGGGRGPKRGVTTAWHAHRPPHIAPALPPSSFFFVLTFCYFIYVCICVYVYVCMHMWNWHVFPIYLFSIYTNNRSAWHLFSRISYVCVCVCVRERERERERESISYILVFIFTPTIGVRDTYFLVFPIYLFSDLHQQ